MVKASRREIRRAIGEPLTDDLQQMADQIVGLLYARDYLATQIAEQGALLMALNEDVKAMALDLRMWRKDLSRWQRLRWLLKL